jgi:NAD-dependent dihydropyrimidine dehydrogenase PreA subunit
MDLACGRVYYVVINLSHQCACRRAFSSIHSLWKDTRITRPPCCVVDNDMFNTSWFVRPIRTSHSFTHGHFCHACDTLVALLLNTLVALLLNTLVALLFITLVALLLNTHDNTIPILVLIRYGLVERGAGMLQTNAFDVTYEDSQCISCGQCTLVCPTGALAEQSVWREVLEKLDSRRVTSMVQV